MYVFNPSGECVGHVSSDVIKSPAGDSQLMKMGLCACVLFMPVMLLYFVFVCSQP